MLPETRPKQGRLGLPIQHWAGGPKAALHVDSQACEGPTSGLRGFRSLGGTILQGWGSG